MATHSSTLAWIPWIFFFLNTMCHLLFVDSVQPAEKASVVTQIKWEFCKEVQVGLRHQK